jgi:cell wall assembly regulator SMI1
MGDSWPQIEERGPVVTDADVRAFEQTLGAPLPQDYRDFLLAVNGGRTSDEHVMFKLEDSEGELNELYALSEIMQTQKSLGDRLPHDVIPVGYDAGGNKVCIALRGTHRGEVWYFDIINELPDDDEEQPIPQDWSQRSDFVRLAPDFRTFIVDLKPIEP